MPSASLKTSLSIRSFIEADRKRLKEIYLLCRVQTFYWCDSEQFRFDDFDNHTEDEDIFVAISGCDVVGFVAVWPPDSFIHHLYVDAAYRAGGMGKALLAMVAEKYPAPLKLKCLVKNELAFSFYQSKGWQVIGEGSDDLGDYYLMEYR
ncbi:ribosomal protein S18 acetylase RimI-like enzyme [Mucilaginibacter oryzae]|uniref:Ribosomal protein S18 acetylase RimI-like enzyme n=1 Tax=Mucilaginibacter oryzae TaxID=468058 RepID=A0A316HB06_9SPHI|nr:GNAT family N-acetyltransferase [Mucilaginibacter oryzae]PWK77676.1 ribosomal protein S18 acetylase RimI-like enzyme [Mucilaginibacter oryzae]